MTECITTPASCERRPTVAVLGAGIAGLTAAHELAERGFVVTVYEARHDERNGLGSEPAGTYPPIKLGGLAASQYSTVGTHDGSQAELRPFPGRRGRPRAPGRAVAGEHGFRFFPAYYLHIWDLFQRIPVYQLTQTNDGTARWMPTPRTIYDNVRRVITQGATTDGKPSLVFPRELPRSPAELLGILGQLSTLGFTPGDIATFQSRLLRYLVTSPLRRAHELQNVSAYDFFVGHDRKTGINTFSYTPRCDALLRHMPRVLVALDSRWGDARTNVSTNLQLYLNMDRRDNKADGVLNGPTTESWFDHWYRHLLTLGVRFVHNAATRLDPPALDPTQPPQLRPRAQITLADGTRVKPDYTVVAVDAPVAEYITSALRAAGTGGTVAKLDGFTTLPPPPDGPLQPRATRPQHRRNPHAMDELGRVPWDRFQTLCGIQYYFDTEFQLVRGHMLYVGTEWALSSINQTGLWEKRPNLDRDGHISVLSVDIGDLNTPSSHLVDEFGRGKAARDCTPDEIAAEVWRQIISALTSNAESAGDAVMPGPVWYALDRGLTMATGPGQGQGRVIRNETPYLVPIVGDWNNRPSSDPWNPHGTSWTSKPTEDGWLEDLEQWNVWQARHGGYQVHNNSVVFAGTWNKTFTRLTSMEAACESGRHAVNAILDHYIWVQSGGLDRRENTTLKWEFPYGFLDQGFSSPIRLPTPAGDYCYIFDIENREPADTRALRMVDSAFCQHHLPHPLDTPAALSFGVPMYPTPPLAGGQQMFTPATDYNQQFLAYLQAWQQLLQQWMAMTAGLPFPTAPSPIPGAPAGGPFMPPTAPFMSPMPPFMPAMPAMPPTPTAPAPPMPPAPADYTQQLLSYLQAWRQYLEQMTGQMPGSPQASTAQQPTAQPAGAPENHPANHDKARPPRPPDGPTPPGDGGSKTTPRSDSRQGSDPTWPPPLLEVKPDSFVGSQITAFDPAGPFDLGSAEPQVLNLPDYGSFRPSRRPSLAGSSAPPEVSRDTPEALVQLPVKSAFSSKMSRVEPIASPVSAPESRFSRPGAQTASEAFREARETPSP